MEKLMNLPQFTQLISEPGYKLQEYKTQAEPTILTTAHHSL